MKKRYQRPSNTSRFIPKLPMAVRQVASDHREGIQLALAVFRARKLPGTPTR